MQDASHQQQKIFKSNISMSFKVLKLWTNLTKFLLVAMVHQRFLLLPLIRTMSISILGRSEILVWKMQALLQPI